MSIDIKVSGKTQAILDQAAKDYSGVVIASILDRVGASFHKAMKEEVLGYGRHKVSFHKVHTEKGVRLVKDASPRQIYGHMASLIRNELETTIEGGSQNKVSIGWIAVSSHSRNVYRDFKVVSRKGIRSLERRNKQGLNIEDMGRLMEHGGSMTFSEQSARMRWISKLNGLRTIQREAYPVLEKTLRKNEHRIGEIASEVIAKYSEKMKNGETLTFAQDIGGLSQRSAT